MSTPTFAFSLTSPAFGPGLPIPQQFTCDGQDVSPALSIAGAPEGAVSLALLCDDPDAPVGDWVHWLVFNLPPTTTSLPEGASQAGPLPEGARQGVNSWKRQGYGGPCPPSGEHRYFFKLYALDCWLDLPAGADKQQFLAAIDGRVLAQTELMGVYSRS